MTETPRDPWARLADHTPARIALGRTGSSQPTSAVLSFGLAHAQARDAVYATIDSVALRAELVAIGLDVFDVDSRASDRPTYLRRPDLGRALSRSSLAQLQAVPRMGRDVVIMIGDGLSAKAVSAHAVTVIAAFLPLASQLGVTLGPMILATGARVALGDEIGATLEAKVMVVLIGERPGVVGSG